MINHRLTLAAAALISFAFLNVEASGGGNQRSYDIYTGKSRTAAAGSSSPSTTSPGESSPADGSPRSEERSGGAVSEVQKAVAEASRGGRSTSADYRKEVLRAIGAHRGTKDADERDPRRGGGSIGPGDGGSDPGAAIPSRQSVPTRSDE